MLAYRDPLYLFCIAYSDLNTVIGQDEGGVGGSKFGGGHFGDMYQIKWSEEMAGGLVRAAGCNKFNVYDFRVLVCGSVRTLGETP